MLHNHVYETVMLFLGGAALGAYLFELRRFYRRFHPPSIHRPARRANATEAKKQTAARSV